jgi:hypothetical protein
MNGAPECMGGFYVCATRPGCAEVGVGGSVADAEEINPGAWAGEDRGAGGGRATQPRLGVGP